MNELYPIIRRKRRPLIVDAAPVAVPVEVPPVPLVEKLVPSEPRKTSEVKTSHAGKTGNR